jgi:hypothetical protein
MKRTSKSKQKSRRSSKTLGAWGPEVLSEKSAEAEQIDRLLSSALRLWEVEREIIEERKDARNSKSKDKEV